SAKERQGLAYRLRLLRCGHPTESALVGADSEMTGNGSGGIGPAVLVVSERRAGPSRSVVGARPLLVTARLRIEGNRSRVATRLNAPAGRRNRNPLDIGTRGLPEVFLAAVGE